MSIADTRTPDPKRFVAGATGDWEIVVGMEVHAQVLSEAKLFSGAATGFGAAPNDHVSLPSNVTPPYTIHTSAFRSSQIGPSKQEWASETWIHENK